MLRVPFLSQMIGNQKLDKAHTVGFHAIWLGARMGIDEGATVLVVPYPLATLRPYLGGKDVHCYIRVFPFCRKVIPFDSTCWDDSTAFVGDKGPVGCREAFLVWLWLLDLGTGKDR